MYKAVKTKNIVVRISVKYKTRRGQKGKSNNSSKIIHRLESLKFLELFAMIVQPDWKVFFSTARFSTGRAVLRYALFCERKC